MKNLHKQILFFFKKGGGAPDAPVLHPPLSIYNMITLRNNIVEKFYTRIDTYRRFVKNNKYTF